MHDKEKIVILSNTQSISESVILFASQLAKVMQNELLLVEYNNLNAPPLKNSNLNNSSSNKIQKIVFSKNIITDFPKFSNEIDTNIVVLEIENNYFGKLTANKTLKLISSLRYPCLVLQHIPKLNNLFNDIVFPVDYTREIKEKALWAAYFGKYFNSIIHLIHYNETDDWLKKKITNNLKFITKIFDDFKTNYKIKNIDTKNKSINHYSIKYADEIQAAMTIIMTARRHGLDKYLFPHPEKKIIFNPQKVSVLCINPLDDLYVPCM